MESFRVQINGLDVDVAPGTSILKAAEKVGV